MAKKKKNELEPSKEFLKAQALWNDGLPHRKAEIDAAEKVIREHLAKLKKVVEEGTKLSPHFSFWPNPPQAKFLKMLDEGVRLRKHYDFAATFGTWTGKTRLLAEIIWNACATHRSRAFDKLPLFCDWPFSKHIRIGCAPDQMNQFTGAVWQAITDVFPKDGSWEPLNAGKHYPSIIKLPNGWKVDVRTYEQSGIGKESADIGLFLFDEPPPLDDWYRAAGRRKHGGVRIIFGSFIDDNGEQPALFEEIIGSGAIEHFFACTDENLDDHKEIVEPFGECKGYLPADITRQMMAQWPKHNAEARRTGKPNILSSMVFQIEPGVHVVPREAVPKDLTMKLAFDPHDVRPGVIVVGGYDKSGALWIVDEWPSIKSHGMPYTQIQTDTLGTKQYSDLLASTCTKHGVALKIIDSNFADTKYANDNSSTNLRRELWKHGRHMFVNGVKDVMGAAGGINVVRELLAVHDTPRGKRSKLYIVNDLQNCIDGMSRLKRKRYRDELTGKVSDILEDRFLDYPRCIMYLAMSGGGYRYAEQAAPVAEQRFGHNRGADFERELIAKWTAEAGGAEAVEEGIADMAIA